ncbi:uncharacterized protein EMH_0004900 [Eimeria mitis]|uniref:Reverse transcriptase domain-containing protein n=1 Tax=Eimeria mitis TaxID=44415 RepID=U6K0Q2_9EIME|nr:uncharacterized protein EMH_0004900 [Eimeria mitis]CDJ29862.1 hypothetical protein EMH_0004900 [Eimeria mitis]
MATDDPWKAAFGSISGVFEYRVMPFGLKGVPAAFQANINAYLQLWLSQGVIAYLDDALLYTPDLRSHFDLLRKVLGVFVHHFYPGLRKSRFAQTNLTGRPLTLRVCPETLANVTEVCQFLGSVNCCRMFMGPEFALSL